MDLRRLRAGEWIAGLAGLTVFVVLFLPWYEVDSRVPVGGGDRTLDVTGFEAFSAFDILLVLVALAGLAVFLVTATQKAPAASIAVEGLVTSIALAVTILLFFRVVNIPGDLEVPAGLPFETERTAFAWIGLLATFGVFVGSVVAMRDERRSKPGRPTDGTGVPAAPPEIETLPAP